MTSTAIPNDPVIQSATAPLAEGRWLWRRVYVFGASVGLLGLLGAAVRQSTPQSLPRIADGLVGLLGLVVILYLVAPTAQQIVELFANLKLKLSTGTGT